MYNPPIVPDFHKESQGFTNSMMYLTENLACLGKPKLDLTSQDEAGFHLDLD